MILGNTMNIRLLMLKYYMLKDNPRKLIQLSMTLLFMVSIFIPIKPMTNTKLAEDTLLINNIPRSMPWMIHSFIKFVVTGIDTSTKNSNLLLATYDREDAYNIAQAIATKTKSILLPVDLAPIHTNKINIADYNSLEKNFNEAIALANTEQKKVVLFFHHAEQLFYKDSYSTYKTKESVEAFYKTCEKFKDHKSIAIIVHADLVEKFIPQFKEYFGYKFEVPLPDSFERKKLFSTRFAKHKITIDENLLDRIVRYTQSDTWKKIDTLADFLIKDSLLINNHVTEKLATKCIPLLPTRYEEILLQFKIDHPILYNFCTDPYVPLLLCIVAYIYLHNHRKTITNDLKRKNIELTEEDLITPKTQQGQPC